MVQSGETGASGFIF